MKNFKIKALAALVFLPTLSFAQSPQPNADDLVGKVYAGIHAARMSASEDRTDWLGSDFEGGNGLGGEFGYRYSPEVEFRFSYTDLSFDRADNAPDDSGSAMSIDALYFVNQKNVYLLGGINNLDIENTDVSANFGGGYRYYLADNFAVYAEGKAHYQFDEHYVDFTAQIGLTYFFGGAKKSAASEVAPAQAVNTQPEMYKAAAVADMDKDGVLDSKDQCANTPVSDKVDAMGCTIFAKETLTQSLVINFANNQSEVSADNYADIEKLAEFLKKYENVNVTIAGHTSSQGAAQYNETLSQKRADAVVEILVNEYDIAADRVEGKGFGESQLINTANTQKAHNENRRIEALVEVQETVPVAR